MFRLPALALLGGLAAIAPAQAQIFVPSTSITLNYANNNGCSITARQITTSADGTQLVFSYNNAGTNWISFGVQVALTGTGFARTVTTSAHTGARSPRSDGVVMIRGLIPTLPATLASPSATVTILSCSTAPDPNGPPRNWR